MKIDELKDSIGIKHTIKDYGITEEDFLKTLDEMSEQAFDDQCTGVIIIDACFDGNIGIRRDQCQRILSSCNLYSQ